MSVTALGRVRTSMPLMCGEVRYLVPSKYLIPRRVGHGNWRLLPIEPRVLAVDVEVRVKRRPGTSRRALLVVLASESRCRLTQSCRATSRAGPSAAASLTPPPLPPALPSTVTDTCQTSHHEYIPHNTQKAAQDEPRPVHLHHAPQRPHERPRVRAAIAASASGADG